MFGRKSISVLILVALSIISASAKDVLSIYDSHKKIISSKTLNPHYVGPVFATGGAMTDIRRYITDMAPAKVAQFDESSLTIFETAPISNQVFNFKKVTTYEVHKDNEDFTVMHMEGKTDTELFDIIVEMREGSNYDRTVTVYKNKKADILILWLDSTKLTPKKADINI